MKFKIASLVVFFSGFALLANSMMQSTKTEGKVASQPRSFVVHYLASRSQEGGPLAPVEYRVRAVSSTGEWKETRYSFNGDVSTWGGANDGLYIISGNTKQYFGDHNTEFTKTAMRSEEGFLKSPQFSRIEQVAGIKAYVLRNDAGTEISYSPETGVTPLREVIRLTPGSEKDVEMLEALGVEFKDLSPDEAKLPELPIQFDFAEQKAQSLKAAGQHERAEMLTQAIHKLKSRR
jgi:hypothetical protein